MFIVLASIDRYLSSSCRVRLRQFSTMLIARKLIIIMTVSMFLINIHIFIFARSEIDWWHFNLHYPSKWICYFLQSFCSNHFWHITCYANGHFRYSDDSQCSYDSQSCSSTRQQSTEWTFAFKWSSANSNAFMSHNHHHYNCISLVSYQYV